MKRWMLAGGLAMAAGLVPLAAQAQQVAYTSTTVNMRAGPATVYPVVAVISQGANVRVFGCLRDYTWCDVGAGGYRGWVYAPNLHHPHQGRNVPLNSIATALGIGALAFILSDYWNDHYRDRAWYDERSRWAYRSTVPQYTYVYPAPRSAPVTPRTREMGAPPRVHPNERLGPARGPGRGRGPDGGGPPGQRR